MARRVEYTGSGCDDEQELTFYLPDGEGVPEALLPGLMRRGFDLAVSPVSGNGPEGSPGAPAEGGAAFTAGRRTYMVEGLGGPQAGAMEGLNFLLLVDPGRRRARFNYVRSFFERNGAEAYEQWLDVLSECIVHLRPTYGYEYDSESGDPPHEALEGADEDAAAGLIRTLYSLNYFGPGIVERIGADRIESARAQRITRLDTGGYLFVPQTHLLPEPPRTSYDTTLIAAHLGLGREQGDPREQAARAERIAEFPALAREGDSRRFPFVIGRHRPTGRWLVHIPGLWAAYAEEVDLIFLARDIQDALEHGNWSFEGRLGYNPFGPFVYAQYFFDNGDAGPALTVDLVDADRDGPRLERSPADPEELATAARALLTAVFG
ncbi:hypothetical protein [Thermomonospora amylolytica]|uniref:hypothetical protein n=1 Tax=Thermomonospora amylolytica TaxID=1411117 RepID=UPI000E6BF8DA|nr:hypothetical protein [Thermomonospora amylolytica]